MPRRGGGGRWLACERRGGGAVGELIRTDLGDTVELLAGESAEKTPCEIQRIEAIVERGISEESAAATFKISHAAVLRHSLVDELVLKATEEGESELLLSRQCFLSDNL